MFSIENSTLPATQPSSHRPQDYWRTKQLLLARTWDCRNVRSTTPSNSKYVGSSRKRFCPIYIPKSMQSLAYLHLSKQIKSPREGSFLNAPVALFRDEASSAHVSSTSFNNGWLTPPPGTLSLRKILMYTNAIIDKTAATWIVKPNCIRWKTSIGYILLQWWM